MFFKSSVIWNMNRKKELALADGGSGSQFGASRWWDNPVLTFVTEEELQDRFPAGAQPWNLVFAKSRQSSEHWRTCARL